MSTHRSKTRCHPFGPTSSTSSAVSQGDPQTALTDNLELLNRPEGGKHPPIPGVDRQLLRDVIAYIRSLVVPEAG
jgi:hypothetical protein